MSNTTRPWKSLVNSGLSAGARYVFQDTARYTTAGQRPTRGAPSGTLNLFRNQGGTGSTDVAANAPGRTLGRSPAARIGSARSSARCGRLHSGFAGRNRIRPELAPAR